MGAPDFPIINDDTLPALIEGEVARAVGHADGSLSESRAQELDYYNGKPFGNEVEGESQVVSTDVADTIEGILPIILNIFTSSDDVVRFDPNGPEDEAQAAQQTEVANYVFYRQNNGFLILYEWFKDALIQKNGVVKYWWDEKQNRSKEQYKGLSEGEYRKLVEDDTYLEVEELSHETYPDPAALEARKIMQAKIMQAPPEVQQQLMAQLQAAPIPQLHDVELRIVKDVSKICIQAIPPEEFGVSAAHTCISIQDAPFCYHRTQKSVSDLRAMGCPEEILAEIGLSNEQDTSQESIARDRWLDDSFRNSGGRDNVMPTVWVTDCFYRVDYDGDGIAELRHIIMVGRKIWVNDECDHINFAALTPIIMPHRWIGRSVSELIMDIQFTKSILWRQMLNNLYLTNNPRKAVLSSAGGIVQANLDDLLTSRPGGIMREYVAGAIRNEEVPFVAGAAFPMLEYMDSMKETRTGVTRYSQGTDADSLNKTARGIQMIQQAGAQRTALIARIFAETGLKDLMRGITYMLSKYSQRAMTLKLRNQWVDVDPREWKTQFNMTVNVGLGTGNRDQQLAHLNVVHQQQLELMKTGRGYMVSDENVYNLFKKSSEAMGFKHPELFIADPQKIPPQAKQQPPNPEFIKIQAEAKEGQAKLQQSEKKMQVDAMVQEKLAQIAAQTQVAIAQLNNAAKKELEQMKLGAQAQLTVFEKQADASSQGAEAQQQIQQKATELDVREMSVRYEEQVLQLKKQIEQMAEQHREQLTQATVADSQNRESVAVQAMQSLSGELAKIAQLSGTSVQLQQQSMQLLGAMLAALQAPRSSTIENVRMEDGRVVGATVKSTLQSKAIN